MKAYVFPGQGSQYEGMGKELLEISDVAKEMFQLADNILGVALTEKMVSGSAEELKDTAIAQPAIFVQSLAMLKIKDPDNNPSLVAGHSLGEVTALVAAGVMSFEDGLTLVAKRAKAMQLACQQTQGTMAAVLGVPSSDIERVCNAIDDVVVPANYNTENELVISGTLNGVELAIAQLKEEGARLIVPLQVAGAFHSPLMESAKQAFAEAVQSQAFNPPRCPVYQNVSANAELDPEVIKANLVEQLAAPVRWKQSIAQMVTAGADHFVEVGGKGGILKGHIKQHNRKLNVDVIK